MMAATIEIQQQNANSAGPDKGPAGAAQNCNKGLTMESQINSKHSNAAPDNGLIKKYIEKRTITNAGERSIPLDISRLPGFMQDYIEIGTKHTDAIPGALLTAFLPAIAVNIGNKVWMQGNGKNQYCHIWATLVGPSTTSRKSTCIRLASQTLWPFHESIKDLPQADRNKLLLVINSTTNSRMITLLALNANRLFEFHELGVLLKNSGLGYNAGMKENLTAFYDGDSKIYSNQDRTEYIDRPALSIVAASTPGWIYDGFETAAEQGSGFLQRFIYCVIGQRADDFHSDPEHEPPDYADLHAYDDIYSVFRSLPEVYELVMDLAERKQWLSEHDRVMNKIAHSGDEALLEYASRIYNNVFCSCAIIITLMKNHEALKTARAEDKIRDFFQNLRVSSESVDEALYLCDYYLRNAIPMINIIKEGGAWSNERRILKHLLASDNYTDSHSSIMNNLHIKAKPLADCIRNLEEQEFVEAFGQDINGRGRISKMYRLLPAALDAGSGFL